MMGILYLKLTTSNVPAAGKGLAFKAKESGMRRLPAREPYQTCAPWRFVCNQAPYFILCERLFWMRSSISKIELNSFCSEIGILIRFDQCCGVFSVR